MTTSAECTEHRAVIKYCVKSELTPTDTWKLVLSKLKESSGCSRTLVFEWHRRFREGRIGIIDDKGPGRPSAKPRTIQNMRDVILSDQRQSIDDIVDNIGVSHWTVHSILKDVINMSKVSAQWVQGGYP